ncbi:hypothetical protein LB507_011369 [Fusarium sp. FIESC RH6]|nr:hypothetical protein LB507_011369 [Fusarium sp. FIESC RH6]
MVRTKTRPRTLEERYPNGVPQFNLGPMLEIKPCNRTFTDHTGKQAVMSWESTRPNLALPPLPCWVFYMVHPLLDPSDFDGYAFYTKLENDQGYGVEGGKFRYEFFFLPGATVEECHAHYVAEVKSRGTIWDQIAKVKRAMELKGQKGGQQEIQDLSPNEDATGNSRLPGLLLEGEDHDFVYRNFFFMYADANLDCSGPEGRTREMYIVQFDPVPQHPDEIGRFNPMEHPFYLRRTEARGEKGGFSGGLIGWMEEMVTALWVMEADDATENAEKLGWKSW